MDHVMHSLFTSLFTTRQCFVSKFIFDSHNYSIFSVLLILLLRAVCSVMNTRLLSYILVVILN